MTSLIAMNQGWQRHLRALFRVLAASLVLAVAFGAAHERPDVVVILGPPPRAAAAAQLPPAPIPAAARAQAPRRCLASTHASAPQPAHPVHLHTGRFGPLDPPDLRPHQPGPSLYLAYRRILC